MKKASYNPSLKVNFFTLIKKYKKYNKKLSFLINSKANRKKQIVLEKYISKIYAQLETVLAMVNKKIVVGSFVVGSFAFNSTIFAQTNFAIPIANPFGLVNSALRTSPTFADLDNDGDLDLLTGDYYGSLFYYKNTGSVSSPAFAAPVSNPFGLATIGYNSAPRFVDLDNDGDMDILAGEDSGNFKYFQNIGTISTPLFAAPVNNPFGLANIGGLRAAPALIDLDNDGDLDVLAGSLTGNFIYFRNDGSSTVPMFANFTVNSFGLTNVVSNATPSFVDIDLDGDFDVFVGENAGKFNYFQNTGTSSSPSFGAVQVNPFNLLDIGYRSSPTFADLDNDGDKDLMSGDINGSFWYFKNTSTTPSNPPAPINTTSTSNMNICFGASTVLSVSSFGTIGWYDAATGGNFLGNGTPFSTQVLFTNTTFYAQDSTTVPSLTRTPITVQVAPAIDNTTSLTNNTITANATGATYRWLNCDSGNVAIPGETAQSFNVTTTGNYAAEITIGNCKDTSVCVNVIITSIAENKNEIDFKIYPNPINDNFTIELENSKQHTQVNIVSIEGKVVYSKTAISSNKLIIDATVWSKGVYVVTIISDKGNQTLQLIKQ